MVEFYTNIFQTRNNLLVCGYLDGKRFTEKIPYRPHLFIPSKKAESDYKSLYGEPLERIDFDSMSEARDFIKKYSDVTNFEIHGSEKFMYVYLNEKYPGEINFDTSLIKVWNLDIETGKTADKKYSDPWEANGPITCIGIGIGKKRVAFATKQYTGERKFTFVKCKDEEDLLRKFLNLITHEDHRPDVITGWNIEFFDIPFIINRIRRLLGDDEAKRISPFNIITEKEVESFNKSVKTYVPVGVSILDYYQLYRKFTQNQQESYTLDHIAFVETKKRKLDYSEYESLDDLYEKDFNKFIDYNLTDIDRVADIDAKKKLLSIVYSMAYDAKINYNDTMGSVNPWDCLIHNFLIEEKVAVPPYKKRDSRSILGGFVKDPQIGAHDWPVSYDFTSLYPKLMETFNISPEVMVDFYDWDYSKIDKILQGEIVDTSKGSTCANGAVFSKDKLGVFPRLMALQFEKRSIYKKKMQEAEKAFQKTKDPEFEKEIDTYYNAQWTKKIQLNSLFGSLVNAGCRYYDWRLGEAITWTGQLAAQWIAKRMNEYLNKLLKTDNADYVIAIDTDSVIVRMGPIVKKCLPANATKDQIIEFLDKISKKEIQRNINIWCAEIVDMMNAYQNQLDMKREVIADKAIWVAKKRYIMNMWDKEGTRYQEPELKMMGIEAVRSSTPSICKDAIKETLKIIMSKSEDDVIEYIEQFRQKFEKMEFDTVAFPRGVSDLEKYRDRSNIFSKGAPIHVRGSLMYNYLIKTKGLDSKFATIKSGDKIKFCYLKVPNHIKSNVIAASKILPKQLNLDKYIDYELQFEKTFLSPISNILKVIGWKTERVSTLEGLF